MNIIKGVAQLTDLPEDQITMMEHAALAHRRHAALTFKIQDYTAKAVTIQVVQGKSNAENYLSKKRLIEVVHETFDRFFPSKKVHVQPVEYVASPTDQVTPEWIRSCMTERGIKLKQMASETGLNNTQLSALINGAKPLSQVFKAMFYFYFLSKGA